MKIQQILSEVDLIIIGAGPAGLSGAKKALELQKKVLLVDWGMHTFPHFSAHLSSETHYTTGGIGGTRIAASVGFSIDTSGATSAITSMRCSSFSAAVFSLLRTS